ncbi:hypothetical protein DFP73DRAFT_601696 [Morchella snyderi]|nr:hypothetical protein DFP73DRAFT_601696 [Morchella snyderi]
MVGPWDEGRTERNRSGSRESVASTQNKDNGNAEAETRQGKQNENETKKEQAKNGDRNAQENRNGEQKQKGTKQETELEQTRKVQESRRQGNRTGQDKARRGVRDGGQERRLESIGKYLSDIPISPNPDPDPARGEEFFTHVILTQLLPFSNREPPNPFLVSSESARNTKFGSPHTNRHNTRSRPDLAALLGRLSDFIRETPLPQPEDGQEWNETYDLIEDCLTTLTTIAATEPAAPIPEPIVPVPAPTTIVHQEIITDLTTEIKGLKATNEDLSWSLETSSANLTAAQSQLESVQAELETSLQSSAVSAAHIEILLEDLADWEVAFNNSQEEVTRLSLAGWEYQCRVEQELLPYTRNLEAYASQFTPASAPASRRQTRRSAPRTQDPRTMTSWRKPDAQMTPSSS